MSKKSNFGAYLKTMVKYCPAGHEIREYCEMKVTDKLDDEDSITFIDENNDISQQKHIQSSKLSTTARNKKR